MLTPSLCNDDKTSGISDSSSFYMTTPTFIEITRNISPRISFLFVGVETHVKRAVRCHELLALGVVLIDETMKADVRHTTSAASVPASTIS